MKRNLLLLILLVIASVTNGQEINQQLKSFDRLIASPKINVILEKGETESIRLVYSGVDKGVINIEQHHKTLHIYLENAKILEKNEYTNHHYSRGIYDGASITAYVTYKNLKYLEIRGDQELTCNGPIEAEVFTLKAYGENEINLASLKTSFFKTSLYGENKLEVKKGKAYEQRYRLFGENKINTENLKSREMAMNIYGEGKLKVNATDQLRITAFGEPEIHVNGGAHIRRYIFGEAKISRD